MSQNLGKLFFRVLAGSIIVFSILLLPSKILSQTSPVGLWHLNDGSGAAAEDSSGNGNDGTLTNMNTSTCWVDGKLDNGLDFDGTDDYVVIADDPVFDITGEITVEAWIYPASVSGDQVIAGKRYSTSWELSLHDDSVNINAKQGGTYYSHVLSTGGGVQADAWNHIVWTYDSSTGVNRSYVNGVEKQCSEKSGALATDATALYIGCRYSGSLYFDGIIDEVKIYDRVLSASEIFQEYKDGYICGEWQFDDGSGTTASDSTDNGNDGTLTHMNTSTCWVDGKLSYGLDFDGADDYVVVPDDSVLDITDEITVEAWIYPHTVSGDKVIAGKRYSTSWELSLLNDSVNVNAKQGETYYAHALSTGGGVRANTWNHIVWTYDSSTGINKSYVNGIERQCSETSGALATDNTSLFIGCRYSGSLYFDGIIDEVRIHDRVLDASEILQEYKNGNLYGEWLFEDSVGGSAIDSSGNINDGALTDMNTANCWIDGKVGGGLDFDGADDHITVSTIDIGTVHAVTVWVYADDLSYYEAILGYTGDSYMSPLIFRNVSGTTYVYYHDGTDYEVLDLGEDITGGWRYVAAVRDGLNVTFYLDGVNKGSVTLTNNTNMYVDTIGARQGNSTKDSFFDGAMDEVKIYSRTLFSEEIFQDYLDGISLGYWKFNEGSGSTGADSSVFGNHGALTYMNTSTCWIAGRDGYVLDFYGSDDYVDCGNDSSLNFGTNDFTVEFWMKSDAEPGNYQGMIGKLNTSNWMGWGVQVLTAGTFDFYINRNHNYIFGDYDLRDNIWHHIVAIREGEAAVLYIDGEYIGKGVQNTNDDSVSTTSSLTIGKVYMNFDCLMDDVRIYEGALSEDEISRRYMKRCAYWKFDESSGTTAVDSSGNGNDGTLTNMSSPSCWVDGHIDPDGCFKNVLDFDGSDDYVDCGNNSIFDFGTDDFSISLWVKSNAAAGNYQGIIGKINTSTWTGWGVQLDSGGTIDFYINANHNYITGDYDLRDNNWHHVVAVREGQDAILYVDGEYIGKGTRTTNASSVTTASNLTIGKFYMNLDCLIDEVQVFKKALTVNDVKTLNYNLLSPYPEKNYYTSETSAVAVCDLAMPSSELDGCYLVAKSGAVTLGTNYTPENGTDLTYTVSSLSNGENTITIELRTDSGDLVFTKDMGMVKKSSNVWGEVKVDQRNCSVMVDNNAFFPVGIYMSGIPASDDDSFDEVSEAGFNTVIQWRAYQDPSDATDYLEAAADATSTANPDGLMVVNRHSSYSTVLLSKYKLTTPQDFWDIYKGLGTTPFDVDQSARMLQAVYLAKQEDNLLAYYTFDEPSDAQIPAGQNIYSETNSEDGYHPTFALYSIRIHSGDEFTNWSDILGVDPYWYPPSDFDDLRSSVNWVAKYTALAANRAKQDLKACWIAPVAEFWSRSYKRSVLPAEQECQTYLALINGAKGIFYFRYPIHHKTSWSTLSDLAGELNDLAPSILTQDLDQTISYYENSTEAFSDPADNDFTDIQVKLLKAPAGENYDYVLLAANIKHYSVDVDYKISLLGASGTVSRLFDASTYMVSNGVFSDTLTAFATRAYTFTSSSTDPITIEVDMDPGTATAETSYPVTGRENCTNLMQNPSLEDTSLTNWPDYCMPYYASPRINTANQGWGLISTPDLTGLKDEIENDGGDPLDDGDPGNTCLKITNVSALGYNGFTFRLAPYHTDSNGKDYTFSLYIKADDTDYEVRLGSTNGSYITLDPPPTTSWERYSFTVNLPAGLSEYHKFYLQLRSGDTIWVDAIQVEQASSPSTFTTD